MLNLGLTLVVLLTMYYFIAKKTKNKSKDDTSDTYKNFEDPILSKEMRDSARTLSSTSATIAGISLAAVAFITTIRTEEMLQHLENIVGITLMLSGAVVYFRAYGLLFNASLPRRKESEEKLGEYNRVVFEKGDNFTVYATFLFFTGMVWSLSTINILFIVIPFIAYLCTLRKQFIRPDKSKNKNS